MSEISPEPSLISPSAPSFTQVPPPTGRDGNHGGGDSLQPFPSPASDTGNNDTLQPPSAFVAGGGYIYLILMMAFVVGTVYFCRVLAAKRKERLRLIKEQDLVEQYQNPPLYDHHDRDIPVVVVAVDPVPSYSDATSTLNTATTTTASMAPVTESSPSNSMTLNPIGSPTSRSARRTSQPIELWQVGGDNTATAAGRMSSLVATPASVMVRGEPYAHILTPRVPSPAPLSTTTSLTSTLSAPMQQQHHHGQPPAYEDIESRDGDDRQRRSMVPETRIGISHQHPPGPGLRPHSKP